MPHYPNAHCAYERGDETECAFYDLCARTRWGEQIGVRDAQVTEESVWAVDRFMARKFGLRYDFIGGREVMVDVFARDK